MPEPLNPRLYRQLQRIFGRVRICSEGQKMVARYIYSQLQGRDDLIIDNPGEYYLVCCPRCQDTRFRLYINHTWGKKDTIGRRNLWLAICFNENCFEQSEARWSLYEQLTGLEDVLANAPLHEGEEVTEAKEIKLPGPVFRLDQLPPEHVANQYLAGRFYKPERLGEFYGVGYCPNSPYSLATHRIIVPVYQGGKLCGWQARFIGELDWHDKDNPPTWWSAPGMARARLLYNLDNARKYVSGIAVEGAGDVWAVGPMAVGCFGSTMTPYQRRAFVNAFGKGSGVLLFDPDVLDKPSTKTGYDRLWEELTPQFRHGLARVVLPDGADPGELDRGFLCDFVTKEAKAQGVKVIWRLK